MSDMHNAKVAYIFSALEKAEVSFTDFTRLTRISRESLYRWRGGAPVKDMLRLDLAYTYALRLEKACRAGKLPLANRLKAVQRLATLRKIITEMSAK
jgi:hypothetical protein